MSDEQERQSGQESTILVMPLRRRPRRRKAVYARPGQFGRLVLSLIFITLLASGAVYYLTARERLTRSPYAVEVNGKPLALLTSARDARQAIRTLQQQYAPDAPDAVSFVEGDPKVTAVGKPGLAISVAAAVPVLDQALTIVWNGYAIYVDGKPLVALATQGEAWQTISLMQKRGLGGRAGIPTFKERVLIKPLRQMENDTRRVPFTTPQQAASQLVHPPQQRVHVVTLGDNFWKIATENGMTLDDLIALNPTLDYRNLHAGDQVQLPDAPAPVTVVVRGRPAAQHPRRSSSLKLKPVTTPSAPATEQTPPPPAAATPTATPVTPDRTTQEQTTTPSAPHRQAEPRTTRREHPATESHPAPTRPHTPARQPAQSRPPTAEPTPTVPLPPLPEKPIKQPPTVAPINTTKRVTPTPLQS